MEQKMKEVEENGGKKMRGEGNVLTQIFLKLSLSS